MRPDRSRPEPGPLHTLKASCLAAAMMLPALAPATPASRPEMAAAATPPAHATGAPAGLSETAAKKPAPARLKDGRLRRGRDGGIELVQHAPVELRVCPPTATVTDCPFRDLARAMEVAQPGDTIVMAPGIYPRGAVVDVDDLTIRAEPGAHLRGGAVRGKAALVITGARVTVDGLECSGIAVRDRNGACIRIEGDDLTVRNVNFHDNEQGILSGPGGGTLLVENSTFERNGRAGRAHGLYIGKSIDTFVFRNNRVLSTQDEGHGVKSRARRTVIEGNIIASQEGQDSRAIDLPNGGEAIVRNNVLQKGPRSVNSQMIGLALESGLHATNSTVIEGNLIVFDRDLPWIGRVLDDIFDLAPLKGRVILSKSPGPVTLKGNIVVGAKEIGLEDGAGENAIFRNRKQAKLPPFPALPPPPKSAGAQ